MIDLHERLSEFSYGYGVTREVEKLLTSLGIRTVPFLPSLLQEKQIGFDVGFGGRGVPLLLQFKLGHSLHRFVRSDKSNPAPALDRPFFRFSINTGEPDGQFETLLKAEQDGAETYYIAPRFADWPHYVNFFEAGEVLQRSVIVSPKNIRAALDSRGSPDGVHRVVYDTATVHVCSSPTGVSEVPPELLAESIVRRLRNESTSLRDALRKVYGGLEDRSTIRRLGPKAFEGDEGIQQVVTPALDQRASGQTTRVERTRRYTELRERSLSEDDALAAALGLEFWALGIQLLFALDDARNP